jgi:uncharacterized protein YqeY
VQDAKRTAPRPQDGDLDPPQHEGPALDAGGVAEPEEADGGEAEGSRREGMHGSRLSHPQCKTGGMAELKERVRRDLTAAMKSRDDLRASTLRMALTAIRNAEVAGKEQRELSDDEVTEVITSEAKKRREAAQAFADAERPELASKETAEAAILMEYLPEQLDAEAIRAIVTETVEELGVGGDGMRAMGRVMGALQPKVKGRAEGGVVAAEVKRQLGA